MRRNQVAGVQRSRPQRHDDVWLHNVDLLLQKGSTVGYLCSRRSRVVSGSVLRIAQDRISYEHLIPTNPHLLYKRLKIVPRLIPVERQMRAVCAQPSRRFPDEEDRRIQRAATRPQDTSTSSHSRTFLARLHTLYQIKESTFLRTSHDRSPKPS